MSLPMSSSDCTRAPINLPSSQLSDLSIAHHSFSCTSLVSTDGPSMSSRAGECVARHQKEFLSQQGPVTISFQHVTIGSLPDNVLLDIFDFYQEMIDLVMGWHRLVQVCRRWRYLVFTSPRRLGLKLYCEAKTPVKEILDVWPSMQIFISDHLSFVGDTDNIIAALEHPDRVCHIHLHQLGSSLFERLATLMEEPFPVLRHLSLSLDCFPHPSVLPDTFLGGSAPCLDVLHLSDISFPALPKLLLSARNLVRLELYEVPRAGYISPEAMVTCLSALTNLELFTLKFESPYSCPDQGSQRPPLLTRVDLPALAKLEFYGAIEYLEDFLARINTPIITTTEITFFDRDIRVFDIPQLFDFVSRIEAHHESPERAQLCFGDVSTLSVHRDYSPLSWDYSDSGFLSVGVQCEVFDWKRSFLVQICRQLLPLLSMERLDIVYEICPWPPPRQYDVDHTQWLEILRPFIAVQSLHIDGLESLIAPALQELTGARVMEVLPALRSIFVKKDPAFLRKAIEPFITARHFANRPVTVHWWEDEGDWLEDEEDGGEDEDEDEDEDVR